MDEILIPEQLDLGTTAEPEAATAATEDVSENEESAASAGDPPATPKSKGVQKRIDELTTNWRSAERDRDAWKEVALQHVKQPTQQAEPAREISDTPPSINDFSDIDEYIAAKTKYEISRVYEEERRKQEETSVSEQRKKQAENFKAKAEAAKSRFEDFDDVVFNRSLPISETMQEVILGSEKGAEIAYYLGKNPELSAKIASLPPIHAAKEMGRLEAAISAPKRPTGAPPPIETVGSGEVLGKEPSQMSTKEWMEWRRKQIRGVK